MIMKLTKLQRTSDGPVLVKGKSFTLTGLYAVDPDGEITVQIDGELPTNVPLRMEMGGSIFLGKFLDSGRFVE